MYLISVFNMSGMPHQKPPRADSDIRIDAAALVSHGGRELAPLRFESFRQACESLRNTAARLPRSEQALALHEEAERFLRCIEREAAVIEELSTEPLGDAPCQRLVGYCKMAASSIAGQSAATGSNDLLSAAAELGTAFLALIPRILDDYGSWHRAVMRSEREPEQEPAGTQW